MRIKERDMHAERTDFIMIYTDKRKDFSTEFSEITEKNIFYC